MDFSEANGEANMMKVIRWMSRIEQGSMPDETALKSGYDLFLQDQGIS
jgi:hypothetical protein